MKYFWVIKNKPSDVTSNFVRNLQMLAFDERRENTKNK